MRTATYQFTHVGDSPSNSYIPLTLEIKRIQPFPSPPGFFFEKKYYNFFKICTNDKKYVIKYTWILKNKSEK